MYQVANYLLNSRSPKEQGYYGRFVASLFCKAAKEVSMWPEEFRKTGEADELFASVIGIIHPNDGHPQEEMTPDFAWFRPLSANNPTWVLYWPELEV
jgi:hypothetical protein